MIPKAREVRLKPKVRKVLEARCRAPSTAQRDVKRALSGESRPLSEVFGVVEAARNLEEAADGLLHVALLLHDHVMSEVVRA